MSKREVMRLVGSLLVAGILLNTSLMILSISWGNYFYIECSASHFIWNFGI